MNLEERKARDKEFWLWLRRKTMREFHEEHPELSWSEVEATFARYDASRRYGWETNQ